MEYKDFSKEQQAAMCLDKDNILVSAGAGSGKTAIIIERLFQLFLQKDVKIDEVLLITFTNNAASELKDRLYKKLVSNEKTKELASKIDACEISTFDSFALRIVNKYGYLLGLPQNITPLDGTVLDVVLLQAYNDVLEEEYKNKSEDFMLFVNNFVRKSDNIILKVIKSMKTAIDNELYPNEYLDRLESHMFTDESFTEIFGDYEEIIWDLEEKLRYYLRLLPYKNYEDYTLRLEQVKNYEELYNFMRESLPRKNNKNDLWGPDDEIALERVKYYKDLLKSLLYLPTTEDLRDDYLLPKKHAAVLLRIYKKINTRLDEFKKQNNVYEFIDISRFAIKILQNHDILENISHKYSYIFVDEFQDTSDIQTKLIELIGNHNVYYVGDIKQSIYGFRNANIENFKRYYENYSNNFGGRKFDLVTNFRSRSEVIDSVKALTNHLIMPLLGDAFANNVVNVQPGLPVYNTPEAKQENYDMEIYTYELGDVRKKSDPAMEAEIIASDILKKIKEGFKIYDTTLKAYRPCEYRDFHLLFRKRTHFPTFLEVFRERKIPTFYYQEVDVSKLDVYFCFRNLLILYEGFKNNSTENGFVHAFVSIARSFLFTMSDDEIREIVQSNTYLSNNKIADILSDVVNKTINLPLVSKVNALVQSTDFYNRLTLIGDVFTNTYCVQELINIAENMDKFSFDVIDLLDYLNNIEENDLKLTIPPVKQAENVVVFQTIHGSKGLEYPIVYYPNLTAAIGGPEANSRIMFDAKYGFVFPPNKGYEKSLLKEFSRLKRNEKEVKELIWLYYVAFTRAREKIILVYPDVNKRSKFELFDLRSIDDILRYNPSDKERANVYLDKALPADLTLDVGGVENASLAPEEIKIKNIIKNNSPKVQKEVLNKAIPSTNAINLGTKLHEMMEYVDFSSRNLDFIKDNYLKNKIKKIISLTLFKDATKENTYKEYSFINKDGDKRTIDCFILLDKEIILIDYKLKNLEVEEYNEQVKEYAMHLYNLFKKPVRAHLVSLVDADILEVDVESVTK